MSEAPEAPQGGALSIDDAVALLDRRDEEDEASSHETDEFEGVASTPEEPVDWTETPDDEVDEAEAEDEGEVDPLAPPKYWSKEAKARFAELDPDLQAVVLSQEGPREEAAAKAKTEAEAVRSAALDEAAEARAVANALAHALPEAVERFEARWQGAPDWAAIAEAHGVEAMNEARALYAAEKAQLEHAMAAAHAAQRADHNAYVAGEFRRLKALDPELADPAAGDQRRAEVARYLQGSGLDPAALAQISAFELSLARKAMLWDRAQQRARASVNLHRPAPQATRSLARGGASAGPADPKARRAAQAAKRFAKSRSVEDAVALLNAQGD